MPRRRKRFASTYGTIISIRRDAAAVPAVTGGVERPWPGQPRDDHGPVFREPWEAQAFAMTLRLHEAGHFTWAEWGAALAAEIAAAKDRGEPDLGDTYYRHWLAALEKLAAAKKLLVEGDLLKRKADWAEAARRTRHGHPVALPRDDNGRN